MKVVSATKHILGYYQCGFASFEILLIIQRAFVNNTPTRGVGRKRVANWNQQVAAP